MAAGNPTITDSSRPVPDTVGDGAQSTCVLAALTLDMQAGGDRQPAFFANRGTVRPADHYAAIR
jgi:hypothetical protein